MPESASLNDLLNRARRTLESRSQTPSLDAQLLMMRTLGRPRAWLLAHPEFELNSDQRSRFNGFVERCLHGEALPYVLGWWEFYGRQFHLTHDVLIPRPETELLVQVALTSLARRQEKIRVIEVGTGSGCLLATMALEMPQHDYVGTDISRAALAVAQKNLLEYRLQDEVALVQADLLSSFSGPFDLVVANLPYIPQPKLDDLEVAQREPRLALDGGRDGLALVRRLAQQLPAVLAPGAEVALELDPEQMEATSALLQENFDLEAIEVKPDLAGRDRVLHAVATSNEGIVRG